MIKQRLGNDDELGVLVSLAIAVGMIIGAVATLWIWSAVSDQVKTVASRSTLTNTENTSRGGEACAMSCGVCKGVKIVQAAGCQAMSSAEVP